MGFESQIIVQARSGNRILYGHPGTVQLLGKEVGYYLNPRFGYGYLYLPGIPLIYVPDNTEMLQPCEKIEIKKGYKIKIIAVTETREFKKLVGD